MVHWGAPVVEKGVHVFYDVQLRRRIEGKPSEWDHAAEIAKTDVALRHLQSGTIYEVRVRGWVNKKPSAWQIKEEAFKTKGEQTKDDGQAGTPQIGWIKADDIGPRACVAKWSLLRELDVKVGYDMQIGIRIEGKAGEWEHEAETAKNSIIIDGLKPGTLYGIRVRPWANKKAGNWKILENAFKTRKAEDDDGDGEGEKKDGGEHETGESPKVQSQPGVIKVSKANPNSALIHWGASKVPGETKPVYDVQIRRRLAGKPTEWGYVGETFKSEFAVGKLEPGTLYEVRVRAWANRTPGSWQIKENAFTTVGGEGEQTIDQAGHVGF